MPDQKIVLTYIKIKAHAERGVGHEQEVARRKLSEMELEHPGIREEADRWAQAQEAQRKADGGAPARKAPNWDDVFSYVERAFKGFSSFAENVANTQAGRDLADHIEPDMKLLRNESLVISMKLSPQVLAHAQALNELQRTSFSKAMHEILAEQIQAMFGALDGVEDEE